MDYYSTANCNEASTSNLFDLIDAAHSSDDSFTEELDCFNDELAFDELMFDSLNHHNPPYSTRSPWSRFYDQKKDGGPKIKELAEGQTLSDVDFSSDEEEGLNNWQNLTKEKKLRKNIASRKSSVPESGSSQNIKDKKKKKKKKPEYETYHVERLSEQDKKKLELEREKETQIIRKELLKKAAEQEKREAERQKKQQRKEEEEIQRRVQENMKAEEDKKKAAREDNTAMSQHVGQYRKKGKQKKRKKHPAVPNQEDVTNQEMKSTNEEEQKEGNVEHEVVKDVSAVNEKNEDSQHSKTNVIKNWCDDIPDDCPASQSGKENWDAPVNDKEIARHKQRQMERMRNIDDQQEIMSGSGEPPQRTFPSREWYRKETVNPRNDTNYQRPPRYDTNYPRPPRGHGADRGYHRRGHGYNRPPRGYRQPFTQRYHSGDNDGDSHNEQHLVSTERPPSYSELRKQNYKKEEETEDWEDSHDDRGDSGMFWKKNERMNVSHGGEKPGRNRHYENRNQRMNQRGHEPRFDGHRVMGTRVNQNHWNGPSEHENKNRTFTDFGSGRHTGWQQEETLTESHEESSTHHFRGQRNFFRSRGNQRDHNYRYRGGYGRSNGRGFGDQRKHFTDNIGPRFNRNKTKEEEDIVSGEEEKIAVVEPVPYNPVVSINYPAPGSNAWDGVPFSETEVAAEDQLLYPTDEMTEEEMMKKALQESEKTAAEEEQTRLNIIKAQVEQEKQMNAVSIETSQPLQDHRWSIDDKHGCEVTSPTTAHQKNMDSLNGFGDPSVEHKKVLIGKDKLQAFPRPSNWEKYGARPKHVTEQTSPVMGDDDHGIKDETGSTIVLPSPDASYTEKTDTPEDVTDVCDWMGNHMNSFHHLEKEQESFAPLSCPSEVTLSDYLNETVGDIDGQAVEQVGNPSQSVSTQLYGGSASVEKQFISVHKKHFADMSTCTSPPTTCSLQLSSPSELLHETVSVTTDSTCYQDEKELQAPPGFASAVSWSDSGETGKLPSEVREAKLNLQEPPVVKNFLDENENVAGASEGTESTNDSGVAPEEQDCKTFLPPVCESEPLSLASVVKDNTTTSSELMTATALPYYSPTVPPPGFPVPTSHSQAYVTHVSAPVYGSVPPTYPIYQHQPQVIHVPVFIQQPQISPYAADMFPPNSRLHPSTTKSFDDLNSSRSSNYSEKSDQGFTQPSSTYYSRQHSPRYPNPPDNHYQPTYYQQRPQQPFRGNNRFSRGRYPRAYSSTYSSRNPSTSSGYGGPPSYWEDQQSSHNNFSRWDHYPDTHYKNYAQQGNYHHTDFSGQPVHQQRFHPQSSGSYPRFSYC